MWPEQRSPTGSRRHHVPPWSAAGVHVTSGRLLVLPIRGQHPVQDPNTRAPGPAREAGSTYGLFQPGDHPAVSPQRGGSRRILPPRLILLINVHGVIVALLHIVTLAVISLLVVIHFVHNADPFLAPVVIFLYVFIIVLLAASAYDGHRPT